MRTKNYNFIAAFIMLLTMLSSWRAEAQCQNANQYPGTPTLAPLTGTTIISAISWQTEYSAISNVAAATIYECAIPGGYITIREGAPGGPVIAHGPSPLQWTSTVAGTYYAHWNTNASCGTATTGLQSSITYISPATACNNPVAAGSAVSTPASACPAQSISLTLSGATIGTGLTYQWQSSAAASGPWTNIVGATNGSYSTTQTAPTYYRCEVICSAGTPSFSTPVFVNVNPFTQCYCSVTNGGGALMDDVSFGSGSTTFWNDNTAATPPAPPYYTLFTTGPSLTQGASYNMGVTAQNPTGYGGEIVSVWIDFNQNGSYEPTEWTQVGTNVLDGTTGFVTLNVPIDALPGNTGMRVRSRGALNQNGANDACLNMGSGETEDYVVTIIAANPCTGTPDAGSAVASETTICPSETLGLSLNNATIASGITYQWVSSTSASGPWTALAGATSSTLNTNISEDTYFACILTCTNTAAIDTSSTVLVLSTPFLNCYCTSEATSPDDEDIFNVTLAGIDNSSDCSTTGGPGSIQNMYSDYTAVAPAQLVQTLNYPISIEVGTCGGNFGNWTKAWIDYNQNGSFSDPGEEVYSSAASTVGAHFENGIVSIPLSATPGLTRMRVKVVEFGNAGMTPCGNFAWGETEDYFVNIIPAPDCANPSNITATGAVDSVITSWNWAQTLLPISGYNLQLVNADMPFATGTTYVLDANSNETIFDTDFISGQSFDVYLQAVCGQDTSYFVGPISVVLPMSNDTICGAAQIPVDGNTYVFNNTGANFNLAEVALAPPVTGAQTTTGWANQNLELTTWFKFVAPASGDVRINSTALPYNGQIAVYSATSCSNLSSFQLVSANDDDLDGANQAPNFTICGLTPGTTYYLLHDASSFTAGNYAISIYEIDLNAGVEGEVLEVCYGNSVNLFNGIANYQLGGTWTQTIPTLGLQGSTFNTNGLASVLFEFTYTREDGCASDESNAFVNVNAPSSAGTNGTFTVCKNEPFNLLSGLSGTVDLGGYWLDPSNNQLAGNLDTASNIPGSFNYDYIVVNGVCPADTSTVLVIVDGNCDFTAGIETLEGSFAVYPNPSSDVINITNDLGLIIDRIELFDMSGRVVVSVPKGSFNNDFAQIDVTNLTTGVYTLKMTAGAQMFTNRIVKQ
jgi:hypothetical protein